MPLVKCKEWVCVEREPIWGTEVTHNSLCKILDTCFYKQTKDIYPKGETPVRQCVLPDHDRPNIDLEGVQLMTCDYIKGTEGHYMPRESFLNLRKYERMIEKITLPTLFTFPKDRRGLQIKMPRAIICSAAWGHLTRCCQIDDGTRQLAEITYKYALKKHRCLDMEANLRRNS